MSDADEECGQSEVDILSGGEDQLYDEVADDAKGSESWQEAKICILSELQSGPRVMGLWPPTITFIFPYLFRTTNCYLV